MRKFQSTLPVWGGTTPTTCRSLSGRNFNPPSPCGEGQDLGYLMRGQDGFQSTLPVWGGTMHPFRHRRNQNISIHPPRVGRDYFYGRTQREVQRFQSTLPVWGGTQAGGYRPPGR